MEDSSHPTLFQVLARVRQVRIAARAWRPSGMASYLPTALELPRAYLTFESRSCIGGEVFVYVYATYVSLRINVIKTSN